MIKLFLSLLFISINLKAQVNFCKHEFNLNQKNCLTHIDNIKPTQFVLGMVAIKSKIKSIQKAYKKNELHSKIISKLIDAAKGPDNKYYILDGHHSSYALLKSNIPNENKVIHIKIIKDCSNCSYIEFASYMSQDGKSYLIDDKFNKRSFFELPNELADLKDNPYRGLSWLIRKKKCYKKVKVNFLEFIWADVLKNELDHKGIKLKGLKSKELKKLIPDACDIVKKAKYSHLPGYSSI